MDEKDARICEVAEAICAGVESRSWWEGIDSQLACSAHSVNQLHLAFGDSISLLAQCQQL